MCQLCSADKEEAKRAREIQIGFAMILRKFACDLEDVAYGVTSPHGPEAKCMGDVAKQIIRVLVEEWL